MTYFDGFYCHDTFFWHCMYFSLFDNFFEVWIRDIKSFRQNRGVETCPTCWSSNYFRGANSDLTFNFVQHKVTSFATTFTGLRLKNWLKTACVLDIDLNRPAKMFLGSWVGRNGKFADMKTNFVLFSTCIAFWGDFSISINFLAFRKAVKYKSISATQPIHATIQQSKYFSSIIL